MIKFLEESVNIDKEKKLNPFIYVRRYKKVLFLPGAPYILPNFYFEMSSKIVLNRPKKK